MPHLSAVMRRTPCHSKHFRLEGITRRFLTVFFKIPFQVANINENGILKNQN
jgi:hypothetical protein